MNKDDWAKLNEVFHVAKEMSLDERPGYVTGACGGSDTLEKQVFAMLESSEACNEFLDESAFEAGAALLFDGSDFEGKEIGRYKIVREIGRGGMGAVYLANRADAEFEQEVAIKLIKRGMDTDEIISRFRHERQILASLSHEFIARLLDGGTTDDGLSYFVMEYVDGVAIDKFCAASNLSDDKVLTLFRNVCAAVEHAHKNLVVHRDLKPSNILVNKDGTPKLLDFGIAKVVNSEYPGAATQTGMRISAFTPDYASPEQVQGLQLTTATDVFSLGKILMELVEGKETDGENDVRSPARISDSDTKDNHS